MNWEDRGRLRRLDSGLSSRRRGFDPRPFLVRFMVDKVVLWQDFIRELRL